ncbi:extracellular solute-binding protein, partial [Streptosporangium longisporum]|uniref:extracellular solute-binding protein n=1 Tax=Streptosporangium longisporum TaxID=46187 RepID=UPI0031EB5374
MTQLSRRELLRGAALAGLALPALSACATPAGNGAASSTPAAGATSAANPLGFAGNRPLEIWIFDGGFGDAYARDVHERILTAKHPDLEIKHNATKEVAKTLQPRFAGGNPPEVVNNSGAGAMDFGALVQDGQLADLTPLYDAPSWDDPAVKVRDTIDPAAIELGSYDGRPYVLNYANTVWGIWYSRTLFEAEGWQVPRTWDDFLALCETIRKAGRTAPFTYAGKHPFYIYEAILTLAAKIGGKDVLKNIDNLQEGAWKAEPVRQAAGAFAELGSKYPAPGQPPGSTTCRPRPPRTGARSRCCPAAPGWRTSRRTPPPAASTTPCSRCPTSAPPTPCRTAPCTPSRARSTSSRPGRPTPARAWSTCAPCSPRRGRAGSWRWSHTLTVVKGADQGRTLKPGLKSASTALAAAGDNAVWFLFRKWYAELHDEVAAASGQLMSGKLSVTEWA